MVEDIFIVSKLGHPRLFSPIGYPFNFKAIKTELKMYQDLADAHKVKANFQSGHLVNQIISGN